MAVSDDVASDEWGWPAGMAGPGEGPLAGVRVLDLSAFAVGPWAAHCLGTLGADVIKVDPPYGDPIRRVRPQRHGEPTTYAICNVGKRIMGVDLKDPVARAYVGSLAADADVIIDNHRAGAMDRLGLGYSQVRELNPRIVYCSSGSYGDRGPMANRGSIDPHGQAFSGFVSINGPEGGEPEFLRYSALVDLATATYLLSAALIGLAVRGGSGIGCHVVTSQFESAVGIQWSRVASYLASGESPVPMGSATELMTPSQSFLCRDGRYLNVSAPSPRSWVGLCQAVGLPDLETDARFSTDGLRHQHRAQLAEILSERFAQRDLLWWSVQLTERGVPNGELFVLDEAVGRGREHPLARFLHRVVHPKAQELLVPVPPWVFGRTPVRTGEGRMPGADTGIAERAIQAARSRSGNEASAGAVSAGTSARPVAATEGPVAPLRGLRVLDVTQGLAGPLCGMYLAGLGADVHKLERPEGDPCRELGGGHAYRMLNRQKRVLREAWDHTPDEVRRMIEDADVVLLEEGESGMDPVLEVPEAWISAAALEAAGTIVCLLSPCGSEGPLADVPASELEIQGLSGLTRYLGAVGQPPVRIGADVAASAGALMALCGILGAVYARDAGRCRGQTVHVSSLGSLLSWGSVMVAALDRPDAWEGFHCMAAGYPRTKGVVTADGHLSVSAPGTDEGWKALCEALGAPDLAADAGYATDAQRLFRSRELNRELGAFCRQRSSAGLVELIERLGGMAIPVQHYDELFAHEQVAALDLLDEHPDDGAGCTLNFPWSIDGRRITARSQMAGRWERAGTPAGGEDEREWTTHS